MAIDTAPLLTRQRKFAFALETTTGTKATLAASDGVTRFFEASIAGQYEVVERPNVENLSPQVVRFGTPTATVTYSHELWSASTLPIWTRALQACGYEPGTSGAAKVFKPVTGATHTMSFGHYRPGRSTYAIGCMGTGKLTLPRGKPAMWDWTFTGIFDRPNSTALSSPTYDTTVPPHVGAISFGVGTGDTITVPEIEIDLGNTVILREDITAVDSAGVPTGARAAYITARAPRIRIRPEMLNLAARDWFNVHRNMTTLAFSVTLGAGSNGCVISAPALQLLNPPDEQDDNGMARDALEFACTTGAAGNDDLVFDFTTLA
jgi:hypothetical protein